MRKMMGVALGAFAIAVAARADNRSAVKGPDEDGTKAALVKIAGEGLFDSHAFQYLTELSDDVGSRVTGSAQAQKAVEWGMAKMRAMGLENVHAEKWQLWRGWTRGAAQAELLTPIRRPLHIDAMGWTGSTPAGGVDGEVVTANIFDLDNEMKNMSRFAGKVVLVVMQGEPNKSFVQLFVQLGDFFRAAGKAGAIGVIGGQGGGKAEGMNLTHTGILGFRSQEFCAVVRAVGRFFPGGGRGGGHRGDWRARRW